MPIKVLVKKNVYQDSVRLMVLSGKLQDLPGVNRVAVMMGTDANKETLLDAGLIKEGEVSASANDLIIAVNIDTEERAVLVFEKTEDFLNGITASEGKSKKGVQPRSIESAVEMFPKANFALISTPGAYAAMETKKALAKGLHVMLFSDNVPIEEEIELKEIACKKGLLMMGPDCGTAIINNVPLGFANFVRTGDIGIIGAAGTGIQEISALIHRYGGGITQAIGLGGRDCSKAVNGRMMEMAYESLQNDSKTAVIVIISKPPDPDVASRLLKKFESSTKPLFICFLGADHLLSAQENTVFVKTLEEVAVKAVEKSLGTTIKINNDFDEINQLVAVDISRLADRQIYIRGLFSGGTLCSEAMVIIKDLHDTPYSNTPLKKEFALENVDKSQKHTILDMGEDHFTVGRPHPMIDYRLRNDRIVQEAKDEEVAVLLLDIVIGCGSNADPATTIIPSIKIAQEIARMQGRHLPVVCSICGTDIDPQGYDHQKEMFEKAGVMVMPSNAQAARVASVIAAKGNIGKGDK